MPRSSSHWLHNFPFDKDNIWERNKSRNGQENLSKKSHSAQQRGKSGHLPPQTFHWRRIRQGWMSSRKRRALVMSQRFIFQNFTDLQSSEKGNCVWKILVTGILFKCSMFTTMPVSHVLEISQQPYITRAKSSLYSGHWLNNCDCLALACLLTTSPATTATFLHWFLFTKVLYIFFSIHHYCPTELETERSNCQCVVAPESQCIPSK